MYSWPEWAKLNNLYDIDYGDKVLKSIIATNYIKQKFSILLILTTTIITRLHLVAVFSYIFSYNFYLDLITQIIISVIFTLNSDIIYNIIAKYNDNFYKLSIKIIDNYSPDNFRLWKRNITCGLCFYLIIILIIFEVNSNLLIIYIIQYMITYLILDQFEQKRIEKFINNIRYKPKKVIYGELNIVNDYFENDNMFEENDENKPEQEAIIYNLSNENKQTNNQINKQKNSNEFLSSDTHINDDSGCKRIIDSGMDELLKDLSIMEEEEKREDEEEENKKRALRNREKKSERRRISRTNAVQFVILDESDTISKQKRKMN